MSDIDFDELDKAVNSLMQPKDEKSSDAPESSDVSASQSGEPTVSSVNTTAPADQPVTTSSTSTNQPSLATKRRGKFMDVMHPGTSTATKSPAPAAASSSTPSRRGVSLQPTSGAVEPEASNTSMQSAATTVGAEVSSVNVSPEQLSADEESMAASDSTPDMPDPLDVASTGSGDDTSDATSSSETEFTQPDPLDIAAELEAEPATGASSDESTAGSPFLPDAKVEKRPLGAVEPADNNSGDETETDMDVEPEVSTDTEVKSTDALPKELDASLMSLEGDDTSKDTPAPTAKDKPSTQNVDSTPVVLASPSKPPVVNDSPSASSALPSRTPTMPVDADHDDDVASSIFDTTEHDALKHQTKHSTGWYTLVILAGMAVIGVLGGILFFFMTNSA